VNYKNPFISVVIPTYNRADLLKKAIQSVVDQSFHDWEVVVVDNYSDDNTDEVIDSFQDTRVRLLKIHNNGIIALSRNKGIDASKGKWIAFLDSDDIWYKKKLKICCEYLNHDVDIIYHDLKVSGDFNKLGRKILKGRVLKKPVLIDLLLNRNPVYNSSVIVRKSILDRVGLINTSPNMVASEDYNTWLKIAEISDNFLYLKEILGEYYFGGSNTSDRDVSESSKNASSSFEKHLNSQQLKLYNARRPYSYGRYMYLNGRYDDALTSLYFVLQNGNFRMRIRSLYMIISIYFNRL